MARNTGRGCRIGARDTSGFPWMKLHGGLFGRIPRSCWRAHRAGQPCQHETPATGPSVTTDQAEETP